ATSCARPSLNSRAQILNKGSGDDMPEQARVYSDGQRGASMHPTSLDTNNLGRDRFMKLATTIAGLTLAIAAVYSTPTAAQFHGNASQPVARCQGALPVFETQIRKRPLAIQNEGSASTFV